jgi:hypothetical protein
MYSRAVILAAAAALLAVSHVLAAAEKPAEKPAGQKPPEKPKAALKEGADLPGPFRPFNVVNGKYVNKFHCLTNEYGLNPTVIVFAQNVGTTDEKGTLPKLLRELDQYIVERPKTRLNAFGVFLFNDMPDVVKDDDVRTAHADELTKLKSAGSALQQVVLCLDSVAGLKAAGYELDPDHPVTVVLYDKLKVSKIYPKKGEKDIDVAAIMKEVKENLAPFKK